ncbi:MAG TPA: ABC transporter ATP-binding protein [Actinomycetota bacterium]|nr:ABC transporter ATP-binding protein [Actinomycetota bacterium]
MLEVRGLRAGYGDTPVLHGIDLDVADGELVVVIGPNGHGKTTLLRTVSGLVRPTAGTVALDGRRIDGWAPEAIARAGMVHVPQGDLPFGDMTVEENLLMGAFLPSAWRDRAERLARVFELFPLLAERRSQRARTLSGGERRMLALGRGLMSEARMLMIDEPSLGLAPVVVSEVYRRIDRIVATGMTLLLVEENFSHVRDLEARVLLLESGRIVRQGRVAELLADPAVMTTYLGA